MANPSDFSISRLPEAIPAQDPAVPMKTKAAQLARPNNLIYGLALGAFALISLAYLYYQSRHGTHMKAFIGDLGVLASGLGAALLYSHNQDKEKLIDLERKDLLKAKDPWKSEVATDRAKQLSQEESYTQVLNGIYLGNAYGFATTTHLNCSHLKQQNVTPIISGNGMRFRHVVTLCPIADIQKGFQYPEASVQGLTALLLQTFAAWKTKWHNSGENVAPTDAGWDHLVYNCTRPGNPAPAQLDPIDIHDRFEPIFKVLDRGALHHERVLIHCEKGDTFSVEVVIAYLVNRYSLTYEQALTYVRSKRLCANPVHAAQLQTYARTLANS